MNNFKGKIFLTQNPEPAPETELKLTLLATPKATKEQAKKSQFKF